MCYYYYYYENLSPFCDVSRTRSSYLPRTETVHTQKINENQSKLVYYLKYNRNRIIIYLQDKH